MIRVGFSHANGFWSFLSRTIMWFTQRPYSHCWLLLDGEDGFRGKAVVMEASIEGYRIVPFEGYGVGKTIIKIVTPPMPFKREAVDDAVFRLGAKYNTLGLIGDSWVIMMRRWFHKKVRNPLAVAGAMYCSEAVATIMKESGNYPAARDIDVTRQTPGDVDDMLALRDSED